MADSQQASEFLRRPKFLPEHEQKFFAQLEVKENEVIPANLQETLQEMQQQGEAVDITRLTPEQRRTLQQRIRKAQEDFAQKVDETEGGEYAPSVKQALQRLQEKAREKKARSPEPSPPGEDSKSNADTEPQPGEPDTNRAPAMCPCCGWDCQRPDVAQITESDKSDFTACWLGGLPFSKTYQLLDGKLQFRFRELTEDDKLAINRQIAQDIQSNRFSLGLAEVNAAIQRYQLSLMLVSWTVENKPVNSLPQTYEEWEDVAKESKEPTTAVAAAERYVCHKLIVGDSLKVAVMRQASRFNELAARLAIAAEKDFQSF